METVRSQRSGARVTKRVPPLSESSGRVVPPERYPQKTARNFRRSSHPVLYGWAGAGVGAGVVAVGLLKSKFTLGAWRAPSSVLK